MSEDTNVVVSETKTLVTTVNEFKVKNIAGVKTACSYLASLKQATAKVEEVLGPVKAQAYKTYQEAIKLYNLASKDLEAADKYIRGEINTHLESLKNKPDDLPDGVSLTSRWVVDEVNIVELCKAIGEGKAAPDLVKADTTALGKMATSMKGFMNVAGVKVKEAKSVAIRLGKD
jgi:hypothetical protein